MTHSRGLVIPHPKDLQYEIVSTELTDHDCLAAFQQTLDNDLPLVLRMTGEGSYWWQCPCGKIIEVEVEE